MTLFVLAVSGSPRTVHSLTRRLVSFVLEGAKEAGADTRIIDLCDASITPCTGCEGCMTTGSCVFTDDFPSVLATMESADAVILASPVYIDNVSGQMKVFFDRLADAIHYQLLAGKVGCSIATTHTSGGGEVTSYLNHVLTYLGIVSVGEIFVATGGDGGKVDDAGDRARALGFRLVRAAVVGCKDPEKEQEIRENRAFFSDIVRENRDFRPHEYARWKKNGWMPDGGDR